MLHAVVRAHLAAFLRLAEKRYARPLPRYVRRAFEQYLRCGIPEHGFLRLRCDDCGHDRVVAFSCKERGTCPSCAGRTMSNTAAHLVDRVLPNVPIRQWVLSLPNELRVLAAKRAEVVAAIDRILFREIQRWLEHSRAEQPLTPLERAHGPRDGKAGAVTFVQRFGGSLNLHVHFHVLVLEGLFTRPRGDDGAHPIFHPALPPSRTELLAVLVRVQRAVRAWLRRRGLDPSAPRHDSSDSSPEDEDPDALDALDACARIAIQPGLFDKLEGHAAVRDSNTDDEPAAIGRRSVAFDGFNLHAAVAIGADDDVARERLVRYCARPPFALERLTLLPDGRVAHRIKQPRRNATHRILEPVELLARIAALIPPPRHPFLRYHGVLAPSSKWRRHIVPGPSRTDSMLRAPHATNAPSRASPPHRPPTPTAPTALAIHGTRGILTAPKSPAQPSTQSAARPSPPAATERRPPFAQLTAQHRARLANGQLLAQAPRIEWAKLLRRTFLDDVLACPRCNGRARVIAAVHQSDAARRFLASIDERSLSERLPYARDPDEAPPDSTQPPPPSEPEAPPPSEPGIELPPPDD